MLLFLYYYTFSFLHLSLHKVLPQWGQLGEMSNKDSVSD